MIIYTHIYDAFMKLLAIALCATLTLQIMAIDDPGLPLLLGVLMLSVLLYYALLKTLGTWLYCKFTLKMDLTFAQARTLNGAFAPVWSNQWLPMKELKDIDDSIKYETALKIYEHWKETGERVKQTVKVEFAPKSNKTKVLTVIMYSLFVVFFITSIANVPPSSYIADMWMRIWGDNKYNPIVNWAILILPTYFIFKGIDPNVGKR